MITDKVIELKLHYDHYNINTVQLRVNYCSDNLLHLPEFCRLVMILKIACWRYSSVNKGFISILVSLSVFIRILCPWFRKVVFLMA